MTPTSDPRTVLGKLPLSNQSWSCQIGRVPSNDIVIPHAQVSAHHARVSFSDGAVWVEDLGSANGTYADGARLEPGLPVRIDPNTRLYVGPMALRVVAGPSGGLQVVREVAESAWGDRPLYEVEAWGLTLKVRDRDDRSKEKVLLDDVSFKALPGDMIALMGPSGAGKTTLLLTLTGYLAPSSGLVRVNGEDLYSIFDALRGSIGYVPQDDLVHPELTVFEAVKFSARFRLPPDYAEDEIDARVLRTLSDLGLESIAHLQIGSPLAKVLSGGQRKRVNIALELVTEPPILYLDEPTSGLAADDASSLITLLKELTERTGTTILMTIHQPAREEYEKFSHALILGYGGVPMYYGPTVPQSYRFFSSWAERNGGVADVRLPVDNPRDMFALISARETPLHAQLSAQDPSISRASTRKTAALTWRNEYNANGPLIQEMYGGRRSVGQGTASRGLPPPRSPSKGQFRLLLSRYFSTKLRDKGGTGILLAQAPIIGLLLAVVYGSREASVPGWCLAAINSLGLAPASALASTVDHTGAIFFLVVSAIWFGTSNAAREIVKERSIYLRERMINLGLGNYLMSKFVLLSVLCTIQCLALLGIVFWALDLPGGASGFVAMLGALIATSVSAAAMGLLLSTVVSSSEAAMALTPIALIPQVVLGGLLVPASTIPNLAPAMALVPARWGFEAVVAPVRYATTDAPAWSIPLAEGAPAAGPFIEAGTFDCGVAQMQSNDIPGSWGFAQSDRRWLPFAVLGIMGMLSLGAAQAVLRRRDPV